MAWSDWGSAYSRVERSPMDRFKNKNRLTRAFGAAAVKVYDSLDGAASAEEVMARAGLETDQFVSILQFMLANGIAEPAGREAAPPAAQPVSSHYLPPSSPAAPAAYSSPPPPHSSRSPPGESSPPFPSSSRPPPSRPMPAPSEPAAPPAYSGQAQSSLPPSSEPPISPRRPPYSPPVRPAYAPPASADRSPNPAPSAPAPELYSPPPPISPSPRSRLLPPLGSEPAAPASSHGSDEIPKAAPPSLSPLEKIIFGKYGEVGVKVYNLIDGERTAEDILNETGISETKLVEILEFMNEQGIIKLERPARPPPPAPGPGGPGFTSPPPASGSPGPYNSAGSAMGGMGAPAARAQASKSSSRDEGVGFKPMVEGEEEAEKGGGDSLSPDAVPIDVPILPAHLSILQRAQMSGMLSMKFGKIGHDLLSHIDGIKDFVELSMETNLSMQDLDIILGELGPAGLLTFKQLTRTEISHRYGDDGLAVYKRFGRDGLLIYQMIGKAKSLKEIAQKSHVDPNRAVDMIIFIHKVLGLDLPLDRDTIMRYMAKTE